MREPVQSGVAATPRNRRGPLNQDKTDGLANEAMHAHALAKLGRVAAVAPRSPWPEENEADVDVRMLRVSTMYARTMSYSTCAVVYVPRVQPWHFFCPSRVCMIQSLA